MMNYAHIQNGIVVNLVVADDSWVQSQEGTFIETGDANIEIGGTYENNMFVPLKPFPSWVRNGLRWQAPIELPADGKIYTWDEDAQAWVEVAAG